MSSDKNHHILEYKTLAKVLIGLLFLTVITVVITYFELGLLSTTVALLVASTKATLVLLFFMHLKFDQKIFRILVTIVFALFLVMIVLTFFDYFNR